MLNEVDQEDLEEIESRLYCQVYHPMTEATPTLSIALDINPESSNTTEQPINSNKFIKTYSLSNVGYRSANNRYYEVSPCNLKANVPIISNAENANLLEDLQPTKAVVLIENTQTNVEQPIQNKSFVMVENNPTINSFIATGSNVNVPLTKGQRRKIARNTKRLEINKIKRAANEDAELIKHLSQEERKKVIKFQKRQRYLERKQERKLMKEQELIERHNSNLNVNIKLDDTLEVIYLSESDPEDVEVIEEKHDLLVISSDDDETYLELSTNELTSEIKELEKPIYTIEPSNDDVIFVEPKKIETIFVDSEELIKVAIKAEVETASIISSTNSSNELKQKIIIGTPKGQKIIQKDRGDLLSTPESVCNDFLDTSIELNSSKLNLLGSDFSGPTEFLKPKSLAEIYESESSCSASDVSTPLKHILFNEIEFDAPAKELFTGNDLDTFSKFITPKRTSIPKNIASILSNVDEFQEMNAKLNHFNAKTDSDSSSESEYGDNNKLSQINRKTQKLPNLTPFDNPVDESSTSNKKCLEEVVCEKLKKKKRKNVDTGDVEKKKNRSEDSQEECNEDVEGSAKKRKKRKSIVADDGLIQNDDYAKNTTKETKKKKKNKEELLEDDINEEVNKDKKKKKKIDNSNNEDALMTADECRTPKDSKKKKKKQRNDESLDQSSVILEEELDINPGIEDSNKKRKKTKSEQSDDGTDGTSMDESVKSSKKKKKKEKKNEIEENISDETAEDSQIHEKLSKKCKKKKKNKSDDNAETTTWLEESLNEDISLIESINDKALDQPEVLKVKRKRKTDSETSIASDVKTETPIELNKDESVWVQDTIICNSNDADDDVLIIEPDAAEFIIIDEVYSEAEIVEDVEATKVVTPSRSSSSSSNYTFTDFENVGRDLNLANLSGEVIVQESTADSIKSGSRFSDFWNEDINLFYKPSWGQENFNTLDVQNSMSDDPKLWRISDSDRYHIQQNTPRGPRCLRCHQVGHIIKTCKQKYVPPKCQLCGNSGHSEPRCPNKLCTQCGRQSRYSTTFCSSCAYLRNHRCTLCSKLGHKREFCPDLWRRYHLTTVEGPIIKPADHLLRKDPKHRWCSGCAKVGHFEDSCQYYGRTHHAVQPYVVDYKTEIYGFSQINKTFISPITYNSASTSHKPSNAIDKSVEIITPHIFTDEFRKFGGDNLMQSFNKPLLQSQPLTPNVPIVPSFPTTFPMQVPTIPPLLAIAGPSSDRTPTPPPPPNISQIQFNYRVENVAAYFTVHEALHLLNDTNGQTFIKTLAKNLHIQLNIEFDTSKKPVAGIIKLEGSLCKMTKVKTQIYNYLYLLNGSMNNFAESKLVSKLRTHLELIDEIKTTVLDAFTDLKIILDTKNNDLLRDCHLKLNTILHGQYKLNNRGKIVDYLMEAMHGFNQNVAIDKSRIATIQMYLNMVFFHRENINKYQNLVHQLQLNPNIADPFYIDTNPAEMHQDIDNQVCLATPPNMLREIENKDMNRLFLKYEHTRILLDTSEGKVFVDQLNKRKPIVHVFYSKVGKSRCGFAIFSGPEYDVIKARSAITQFVTSKDVRPIGFPETTTPIYEHITHQFSRSNVFSITLNCVELYESIVELEESLLQPDLNKSANCTLENLRSKWLKLHSVLLGKLGAFDLIKGSKRYLETLIFWKNKLQTNREIILSSNAISEIKEAFEFTFDQTRKANVDYVYIIKLAVPYCKHIPNITITGDVERDVRADFRRFKSKCKEFRDYDKLKEILFFERYMVSDKHSKTSYQQAVVYLNELKAYMYIYTRNADL